MRVPLSPRVRVRRKARGFAYRTRRHDGRNSHSPLHTNTQTYFTARHRGNLSVRSCPHVRPWVVPPSCRVGGINNTTTGVHELYRLTSVCATRAPHKHASSSRRTQTHASRTTTKTALNTQAHSAGSIIIAIITIAINHHYRCHHCAVTTAPQQHRASIILRCCEDDRRHHDNKGKHINPRVSARKSHGRRREVHHTARER